MVSDYIEVVNTSKHMINSVIHSISTPLVSCKAGIESLSEDFPILLAAYNNAVKKGLVPQEIASNRIKLLERVLGNVEKDLLTMMYYFNTLAVNINSEQFENFEINQCSAISCVSAACQRFPFRSTADKNLIFCDIKNSDDFCFKANAVVMEIVLSNILRALLRMGKKLGVEKIRFICDSVNGSGEIIVFLDHVKMPEDMLLSLDNIPSEHLNADEELGVFFSYKAISFFGGEIINGVTNGECSKVILRFPKLLVKTGGYNDK